MDDSSFNEGIEDMVHQRSDDNAPVKITREIPLPWLISLAVGLLVNGVVMWQGQQSQGKLIADLTGEVKELRGSFGNSSLKLVEHEIKLADHERRLQNQEGRR
jgi:hypothetical protein